MSKKIRFLGTRADQFLPTVRKRVDAYFLKNQCSKHATTYTHVKSLCYAGITLALYLILMTKTFPLIPRSLIWMLFGCAQAIMAMNIAHDALHGSYSPNATINRWLGYLCYDLLGLSSYAWKETHNEGHHTYTNIHGHDPDISKPYLLRLSPHDPYSFVHRFQYLYIWFLYTLVGINWVLFGDYMHVWKNRKKISRTDAFYFSLFKGLNLLIMIVFPLFLSPMSPLVVGIGYLLMQISGGFTVAVIFQLAHVVEHVDFPLPSEGNIKDPWGHHEMKTTSNFAIDHPLMDSLIGGLNFQVEHHLFPSISHMHYKKISPIVKQTAKEFGLPYHVQPSLSAALASHTRLLKQLGASKPLQNPHPSPID